jgi:hypothetical protein
MQATKQGQAKQEHILAANIRAFEEIREDLEREHLDEFALFFGAELRGTFPDFDSAARKAIALFGKGPYLIRQVGKNGLGAGTAAHLR